MKIFPPELEIGPTEGFDPQKDIFGRKELGEGLTNLFTNVEQPLVIALDGQWGSGKTTFLKMLAGHLRNAGFPVVEFDAFANDYIDDAFAAIAGEIISLTDEIKAQEKTKVDDFKEKAITAGKVIMRACLKIGTKVLTAGALNAADLEEFSKDAANEVGNLEDRYIGELITKQKERKRSIEESWIQLRSATS